jgi:ketosteroid isomerase-like protein
MDDSLSIVREIYAGFANRDPTAALSRCADDVTIDQDPALPWGGHYVGHEGVLQFIIALTSALDTKVDIETLFQAGDDVVQCGRTRGTVLSNGVSIDVDECHVWTIREGVIHGARFYIDSVAVLEALAAKP